MTSFLTLTGNTVRHKYVFLLSIVLIGCVSSTQAAGRLRPAKSLCGPHTDLIVLIMLPGKALKILAKEQKRFL